MPVSTKKDSSLPLLGDINLPSDVDIHHTGIERFSVTSHDSSMDSGRGHTEISDTTSTEGSEGDVTSDTDDALDRIHACTDRLLRLTQSLNTKLSLDRSLHEQDEEPWMPIELSNNNTLKSLTKHQYSCDDLSSGSASGSEFSEIASTSSSEEEEYGFPLSSSAIHNGAFTSNSVSILDVGTRLEAELSHIDDHQDLDRFKVKVQTMQTCLNGLNQHVEKKRQDLSENCCEVKPKRVQARKTKSVSPMWSEFPPTKAKRAPRNLPTRMNDF